MSRGRTQVTDAGGMYAPISSQALSRHMMEVFKAGYELGRRERPAGTCRMIYDEEASGDELWPTEEYYCSECGKRVYAGKPNYCPNCGRKVVS